MKHSLSRDYFARSTIRNFLLPTTSLLRTDSFLPYKYRSYAALKNFFKRGYLTRLHNYCFYTGRSRGVVREFRISRLVLKEGVGSGFFFGLKRASW